jgi:uridine kinase
MYYQECRSSSKLPEINILYYKYKSNNETTLLHPEIPSPITAFATHNIVVNPSLACLIIESITIYSYIYICNATKCIVYISSDKNVRIILFILDFKIGNGRQSKRLLDNITAFHTTSLY